MGGATGCGNDDLDATVCGAGGKFRRELRRAMRRHNLTFMRDAKLR
jgi:hypothetical protein